MLFPHRPWVPRLREPLTEQPRRPKKNKHGVKAMRTPKCPHLLSGPHSGILAPTAAPRHYPWHWDGIWHERQCGGAPSSCLGLLLELPLPANPVLSLPPTPGLQGTPSRPLPPARWQPLFAGIPFNLKQVPGITPSAESTLPPTRPLPRMLPLPVQGNRVSSPELLLNPGTRKLGAGTTQSQGCPTLINRKFTRSHIPTAMTVPAILPRPLQCLPTAFHPSHAQPHLESPWGRPEPTSCCPKHKSGSGHKSIGSLALTSTPPTLVPHPLSEQHR